MKTQLYFQTLFVLFSVNSFSQTIDVTSSLCGTRQFTFSFIDGTGRNFMGGITDAIYWNASANQWEWTDYGTTPPITFYTNSFASSPNPPCLNSGTWVQTDNGCGILTDISGNCDSGLVSVPKNATLGEFFSIIPNHASGIIQVLFKSTISQDMIVTVFNSHGRKIIEQQVTAEKMELDLSRHSNGIFYVQLNGKEGVSIRKIFLSR